MIKKMTKNMRIPEMDQMPYCMSEEEALTWLESEGIEYEVCDMPVPVVCNKVSCGTPQDIGDLMIDEYSYLPKSAVRLHPVVGVPAKGDSMIEADIHEDDWLRLEVGAIPSDGEIVMAGIDGDFTAKAFFVDDQNRKWLLPKNKKYSPIELTPDCEIRISGVVHHITKKAPRLSYNECMAILKSAMDKKRQEGDVFQLLANAVKSGCHLFWAASAWAVAYCVIRDILGYEGSMKEFERNAMNMTLPMSFKFECTMGTVQRTISNHPYMRLPIDKWKENGASAREIILVEFLKKFLR